MVLLTLYAVSHSQFNWIMRQLIDAMNHSDKRRDEISNKISELTKDLNELDK